MNKKLSISEFNEFKQQMISFLSKTQEEHKQYENNNDFDEDLFLANAANQYLEFQNRLLSYDLSNIPFELWKDLELFSDDDILDMSNTHANIDFNYFGYFGKGNFKNCTIRNLEKYGRWLNEEMFDENTIKNNSNVFLSNLFDKSFKDKYYTCNLEIEDLINLSEEQITELINKNINSHFKNFGYFHYIIDILGINNMIDLYKFSKEDFEFVTYFLSHFRYHFYSSDGMTFSELEQNMKEAKISEMKKLCYDFARNKILNSQFQHINISDYPEQFIKDNDDIFLLNSNISESVRERYYERCLTIEDVIENLDSFSHLPIENFMQYNTVKEFAINLGSGGLIYVLKNHFDVFDYIYQNNNFYEVNRYLNSQKDISSNFTNAVREYFCNYYGMSKIKCIFDEIGKKIFVVPSWLSSLNFEVIEKYNTIEELKTYSSRTLLMDRLQRTVVDTFGIENILKFDEETQFFSHKAHDYSGNLEIMSALGYFLSDFLASKEIDIPNKDNMSYGNFSDIIANCLDVMRKHNIFTDYPDYDFMTGDFREKYPHLFISKYAPEELKIAFYKNRVTGDFLNQHKEYIPFLIDKNLKNVIKGAFEVNLIDSSNEHTPMQIIQKENFVEYYCEKYGNESFLNLISLYGDLGTIISNEIIDINATKEQIDRQYRDIIYKYILKNPRVSYEHLISEKTFVKEHADIFLSNEELEIFPVFIRDKFKDSFYKRNLRFEHIRYYPELIDVLKDKNIKHVFALYSLNAKPNLWSTNRSMLPNELELIDIIGQDKFLEICSKYGVYLEETYSELISDKNIFKTNSNNFVEVDFKLLCEKIENVIIKKCIEGKKSYNYVGAPEFLKQRKPNLFLDSMAPQELQELWYCTNKRGITFDDLNNNKEWIGYLKNKSISTAFLRNNKYSYSDIKKYFEYFGEEKGLKFGLQKTRTIEQMISSHKVELMKQWYDKTGQKFIPDVVVMENFPIESADKFLTSGANWSTLMKIKSFSEYSESRDAMLKLAYCFGAFDQDQVGMKKLLELLTGVPRYYKPEDILKLKKVEQEVLRYNKIISDDVDSLETMPLGTLEYGYLKEELEKDGIKFSSESIFDNLFNILEDKSAMLKLNPQSYNSAMKYLRRILESQNIVLDGYQAHQLFGGFSLKYDKNFREFLLKNLDKIKENPEYTRYISNVQKQFDEIRTFNSNRTLTWDLAISFVQMNKYENINVGNERVAEISAIAGYSQEDFNTLQQIYNYGKIRTFNSVPRIENQTEKYSYEILRLDDPLALAIGTLTNCCQELGNCAELCMEHSMVDNNGRVFVIRDKEGNLVAQSWVWRNKDVLCFDNVEIPDRAFARAQKENGRETLAEEVFNIYKKAAQELIEVDEIKYKKLLESGKITQEQYDGLRLGKITVGLGYNDIAMTIKENSKKDISDVSRPLPFKEPVKLARGLYTSDSLTQYVLQERDNRKEYEGKTLPVHNDDIIIFDNSTFDEKQLLMLEKLELFTKNNPYDLNTQLKEHDNRKNIVSSIAVNYGLNPNTTRIIMNPNFALIYEDSNNKIVIGDFLYNFKVDNGEQQLDITKEVLLQIKVALDKISINKEIDFSNLSYDQLKIFNDLEVLNEEIDIRMGVSHGK